MNHAQYDQEDILRKQVVWVWISGFFQQDLIEVGLGEVAGRMRVTVCVLCDRCVSADSGERRLPVSCRHPSLHEARRPPQLPAVLQTRRRARGEFKGLSGADRRSQRGQMKRTNGTLH